MVAMISEITCDPPPLIEDVSNTLVDIYVNHNVTYYCENENIFTTGFSFVIITCSDHGSWNVLYDQVPMSTFAGHDELSYLYDGCHSRYYLFANIDLD